MKVYVVVHDWCDDSDGYYYNTMYEIIGVFDSKDEASLCIKKIGSDLDPRRYHEFEICLTNNNDDDDDKGWYEKKHVPVGSLRIHTVLHYDGWDDYYVSEFECGGIVDYILEKIGIEMDDLEALKRGIEDGHAHLVMKSGNILNREPQATIEVRIGPGE